MFCRNCGKNLNGIFNICPYCNSNLSNETMNIIYKEQKELHQKQKFLNSNNKIALPLFCFITSIFSCYIMLTSTLLEFNYMICTFYISLIVVIASLVCLISSEYEKFLVILSLIISIFTIYCYSYNYNLLVELQKDIKSLYIDLF